MDFIKFARLNDSGIWSSRDGSIYIRNPVTRETKIMFTEIYASSDAFDEGEPGDCEIYCWIKDRITVYTAKYCSWLTLYELPQLCFNELVASADLMSKRREAGIRKTISESTFGESCSMSYRDKSAFGILNSSSESLMPFDENFRACQASLWAVILKLISTPTL